MSPTESSERRLIYFSGRVQGVGFRYTTRSIASRFAVTGYVRNLADGRVELNAEGTKAELHAFVAEIRQQLGSHIRDETSEVQPASGDLPSFEIRY